MIFVTVGTHEQPFDRLISCVDELRENGTIQEEIIIQTGFSTFEPKHCKWQKLFPFAEMQQFVEQARIVVTHGGPSSFIMPLQVGKIPIVVPRKAEYNEHVNDHQLEFCNAVAQRQGNLIVVEDLEQLGNIISNYDLIVQSMPTEMKSNNRQFCDHFMEIVDELFLEDRQNA